MRGLDGSMRSRVAPLELTAAAPDFSYALRLDADRPLVLQGEARLEPQIRPRAGLLLLQPAVLQGGRPLVIDDKPVDVTGHAWMDREWSSQPLASDQTGWDWFSLHLPRRREADAVPAAPEGRPRELCLATGSRPTAARPRSPPPANSITPTATTGDRRPQAAYLLA